MHIFYKGVNGEVYGPEAESKVQRWYVKGHFSSDVKFLISSSEQADPDGHFYSLGELVDMNGAALPFYLSSEKENRNKKLEETIGRLEKEVESLRTANTSNQDIDFSAEKQMIAVLKSQVASLLESHTELRDKVNCLTNQQRDNTSVSPQLEKTVSELKKKVGEQEKSLAAMKKELSAANSKWDRSDSKLDKSLEKQKEMEESVTVHDKRMTDLSAAMKSIRATLTSVEEQMANTKQSIDPFKNTVENVPPWERKVLKLKLTADANRAIEDPMKERSPWDNQESVIENGDGPDEPWNRPSGRTSVAPWEDCSSAANARSINKKPTKTVLSSSSKKVVNDGKPVSQAKNWDAICREELSEDE